MEAKDEKDMEELRFVPSAVSKPRWPCTCVMPRVEQKKGFKFFEIAAAQCTR